MSMRQIVALENALKLRLVTGNFEIIYSLYRDGPTASRELAQKTKVSVANFQVILRRLREEGIVIIEQDELDGRKRRYALSPLARSALDRALMPPAEIQHPAGSWHSRDGTSISG